MQSVVWAWIFLMVTLSHSGANGITILVTIFCEMHSFLFGDQREVDWQACVFKTYGTTELFNHWLTEILQPRNIGLHCTERGRSGLWLLQLSRPSRRWWKWKNKWSISRKVRKKRKSPWRLNCKRGCCVSSPSPPHICILHRPEILKMLYWAIIELESRRTTFWTIDSQNLKGVEASKHSVKVHSARPLCQLGPIPSSCSTNARHGPAAEGHGEKRKHLAINWLVCWQAKPRIQEEVVWWAGGGGGCRKKKKNSISFRIGNKVSTVKSWGHHPALYTHLGQRWIRSQAPWRSRALMQL